MNTMEGRRRWERGPQVAAIGGGTGLSTMLRGLKNHTRNLTAIVTVADDGGGAGKLREDLGMRYYEAPDLQDVGKNAYRFINAVSDFATHAEPLRRTAHYKENLFARTVEGNPLIDKAYQMVSAA